MESWIGMVLLLILPVIWQELSNILLWLKSPIKFSRRREWFRK